jgi:hypothetical protein
MTVRELKIMPPLQLFITFTACLCVTFQVLHLAAGMFQEFPIAMSSSHTSLASRVVPVLSLTERHAIEAYWGSEGIAARITRPRR